MSEHGWTYEDLFPEDREWSYSEDRYVTLTPEDYDGRYDGRSS